MTSGPDAGMSTKPKTDPSASNRCEGDAAQGNDTLFTYDADGQLVEVDKPTGGDRTMTYDALSRLASVTEYRDASVGGPVTTTYTYDGYDRVVEAEHTQGSTTQTVRWTYDLDGNKTEMADLNGGTNTFTWDELNRLTRETTGQTGSSAGPATQTDYAYDPAGNVLEVDVDGEPEPTTYAYDAVNLVTTVDDQRPGSANKRIVFDYNNQDKRIRTTYQMPGGSHLVSRTVWDADQQPTCIYAYRGNDPLNNTCSGPDDALIEYRRYDYTNDGDGDPTTGIRTSSKYAQTSLKGWVTSYGYDGLMRLEQATTRNGNNTLRSQVYAYDRHSNLAMERTTGSTPGLETGTLWAAHDPGDQVCAAIRNGDNDPDPDPDPGLSCGSATSGQTSYTHDGAGNLLAATGGSQSPGQGGLLAGYSASYNLPGQTVGIGAPGASGEQAQAYDGVMQDRRTTSGDTDMAYGYSGQLTSQATGTSGEEHAELFVRDPGGKLLAMIDYTDGQTGATRYYLRDDQDTVMATVPTTTGSTTAVRYAYEPYGQRIRTWEDPNAGTATSRYTHSSAATAPAVDHNPYGYVSGYTGPTTGLVKFGTRYYAPQLATWTQPDPKNGSPSDPASLNAYAYSASDPMNMTDPSGRYWGEDFVEASLTVAAGSAAFAAVGAIPGVGPAIASAAAGCVGAAVKEGLDGGSASDALVDCLYGGAVGLAGGVVFSAVKNTALAVLGRYL